MRPVTGRIENLDLVASVEAAELGGPEIVGRIADADQAVADHATIGFLVRRIRKPDRLTNNVAGWTAASRGLERWPSPARDVRFGIDRCTREHGTDGARERRAGSEHHGGRESQVATRARSPAHRERKDEKSTNGRHSPRHDGDHDIVIQGQAQDCAFCPTNARIATT